jgi:hypothetical protein
MIDKSLFITYSTKNYEELKNICLSSLSQIGANVDHKLDIIDEELLKKTGFMSDLFYNCIINKVKNLINKLYENRYKYEYYISCDCDIWFLKNRKNLWNNLEQYISNKDYSITFMREDRVDSINGGFFIIRNKYLDISIRFLEKVYNLLINTPRNEIPLLEQTIINNIKSEINFGYIPNDYVIWGHMIYNKNNSLFHHAVCCNDVDDKLTQIKDTKKQFYKYAPFPENFNFNVYRILNDFHEMTDNDIIHHWFHHGQYEGRGYKLVDDFNYTVYRVENNVLDWSDSQIDWHWLKHGQYEGWQYKLPDGFDFNAYRKLNNVLDWNDGQIVWHWLNHGKHQGWQYNF